jgi:hypothetical protein
LKHPDLEKSKSAVLNSLTSPSSQRSHDHAIHEFIDWYGFVDQIYNGPVLFSLLKVGKLSESRVIRPVTPYGTASGGQRLGFLASDRGAVGSGKADETIVISCPLATRRSRPDAITFKLPEAKREIFA